MQKRDTLIITRWDGVYIVQNGKVVETIPLTGERSERIRQKLNGKEIEEERIALEKYPDGVLVPYHPQIPPSKVEMDTLRKISFEEADLALAESFTGDEDIIWGMRLLDEMKEQMNTLREMTTGWETIYRISGRESQGLVRITMFLKEMETTINYLTRFVEERMHEIAPNLCEACGPILGARLIERANGLRRLAMKPSSAVQVLGAEKALFRHLKSGASPPKHGIIFLHPSIQGAPRSERGRKARALASKISKAARKDAFVENDR